MGIEQDALALQANDLNKEVISPFRSNRNYASEFSQIAKALTSARVAVYPIDGRGLMNAALPDAENAEPVGSLSAQAWLKLDNAQERAKSRIMADRSSAEMMASATGGHAISNTNDFGGAVATALENGSSYYSVGFVPTALDGKYHKLQIKIDGVHDQLSYRRGYYADAPGAVTAHTAESGSPLEAALVRGAPPSSQIVFGVRILDASDPVLQGAGLASAPAGQLAAKLAPPVHRVVADLTIDPRGLLFDQDAKGLRSDRVRFVVMAYNQAGERVNYVDRSFTLQLDPAQYEQFLKSGMPVRFPLDLPQGKHAIRVVVEEEKSARVGSFELSAPEVSK